MATPVPVHTIAVHPALAPSAAIGSSDWIPINLTDTWTAIDPSGNKYTRNYTFNGGNMLAISLIVKTGQLNPSTTTSMTQTYYIYTINMVGSVLTPTLVSKYELDYNATANAITGNASDPSGSTLTHDASGNQLYSYNYLYTYKPYNIVNGVATVVDASGYMYFPDASGATSYQLTPFENFLVKPSGLGDIVNFDLLFDYNAKIVDASGPDGSKIGIFTDMLIQVTDPSGIFYLAPSLTLSDISGIVNYNLVHIPDMSGGYTVDTSGYLYKYFVDISGTNVNIVMVDASGNVMVDSSGNEIMYHPSVFVWQYADITIGPSGIATFHGPVIVQLMDLVQQVVDSDVDSIIANVNTIITNINNANFNFGNYADYQELITSINAYVNDLNSAKIELNIEQVTYLEQYALNVQSMSNLFGQMVIQLQTVELVDSKGIAQRMLSALQIIQTGLYNLKAFKLAIAEQNLLKISAALLNISNKVSQLYAGISGSTIANSTSDKPGRLLMLQESLYYFANGAPALNSETGKYYLYSLPTVSAYREFWTDNFDLIASDKADLTRANNLIKSLQSNASNNINLVMSNPQVRQLQNSLAGFKDLSLGLQQAQLNLVQKLALIGFKVQLKPAI